MFFPRQGLYGMLPTTQLPEDLRGNGEYDRFLRHCLLVLER